MPDLCCAAFSPHPEGGFLSSREARQRARGCHPLTLESPGACKLGTAADKLRQKLRGEMCTLAQILLKLSGGKSAASAEIRLQRFEPNGLFRPCPGQLMPQPDEGRDQVTGACLLLDSQPAEGSGDRGERELSPNNPDAKTSLNAQKECLLSSQLNASQQIR